jgi:5-methylcytosine-specific restriction enzyme subunit McrC
MNRTLQLAARGIKHKVAVARYQRSIDNSSNRCLRFAVERLAQYGYRVHDGLSQRQWRGIQRDLNYSAHHLDGIHLDLAEHFLLDPLVTGHQAMPSLRSYYRPALDLALTVIGRRAVLVEERGGRLRLPSLLVDLTTAFEAYIRAVLGDGARRLGWPVRVLNGNHAPPLGGRDWLFSAGVAVPVAPDVVLRRTTTQDVPVVLEVKYKPAGRVPDKDDLNQAITYALAYGAAQAVIVQPRARSSALARGLHRLGIVGDIVVSQYVYDLGAELSGEERAFTEAIGAVAS